MTHPGGGSGGTGPAGGSGTGPGRIPGTPLSLAARMDNYRRQTGKDLTPRQRRRINHKLNRAMATPPDGQPKLPHPVPAPGK
ncbi:hypothetical protein ACIBF5_29750 [Micromonospora sp. NPDC050417]|uniref:hypothetical protein n=1 Tax=Micromonospora sp. NPDC050417 TaxID=3364280 RepID=UPI00379D7BF1